MRRPYERPQVVATLPRRFLVTYGEAYCDPQGPNHQEWLEHTEYLDNPNYWSSNND
jgi:hypothetical protein